MAHVFLSLIDVSGVFRSLRQNTDLTNYNTTSWNTRNNNSCTNTLRGRAEGGRKFLSYERMAGELLDDYCDKRGLDLLWRALQLFWRPKFRGDLLLAAIIKFRDPK